MERHSQQASQRPQERSMGHPNPPLPQSQHQHQPPPGFPNFHRPSTAQPPIQIPFSDPFRNRDPFMPSSTHGRRGSFGIAPGAGPGGPPPPFGERAWSAQPPAHLQSAIQHEQNGIHQSQPPLPTSAHPASSSASTQMSYPYDAGRRRSVGGAGSPPRYPPTGQHEPLPPPPPPSFASRTMPPPSPTSVPPNSSSFTVPAPRPPPTASPYGGSRDLSSYAPRAGPSMSISSLIGGDNSRHGNHSPRTNATAPSPTIRPMHPPSPQRARSASIRTDQAQFGRPQSPNGFAYGARSSDPRAPPLHPGQVRPPVEHAQPVPPQHPAFAPQTAAGFRPFQSSPSSVHGSEEPVRHPGYALSRPSSQPIHQPAPEQELRHRQEMYDRAQYHPSFRPYAERSGRPPVTSQPPGPLHPTERPEGPHEQTLNGHPPPPPQQRMSPHLSQTARSTPAPNGQPMGRGAFGPPFRDEQNPGLFRPSYNPYTHPPPGHREDLDYRGPRNDIFGRLEHRQSPNPSEMARFETANMRGPVPPPHYPPPYGVHSYEAHSNEQHLRRDGDGLHHRSLLGVSAEIARKNGRSSPLPQAVQGAQLRHVGPAADPNIKSEFGRMFSGLGLGGVGSNTPIAGMSANGSATPSRTSPVRQLDPQEAGIADHDGASAEPRSNKRHRKEKEDSAKEDGSGADGRDTPTLGQQGQGNKRTKTAHPAPHHHHHHAHHHHHHHHNVPEDLAAVQPSPFNTLRFPPNAATANLPAPHHHHHHHAVHAHAPHHHHHNPRPLSVPRLPEINVSNQAILSAISQYPRKHLGTQLYDTKLALPPRDSTPLDAKLHFRSLMKPIPHFEGKENCTFTVRVPRGYLKTVDTPEEEQAAIAGGLEEICRTRAVWGTEVYTDDSDVVAAAVHSGWLRGHFGEWDDELRDVFKEEYTDSSPGPTLGTTITEKPKTPLRPLPDADLHITVLLMPPLAKYTATTQHHLRSRQWGSDHDGMSYMIHSIQFTDEGKSNRFTERNAASKHQRIADDLRRKNEAAESLMGLLTGGSSVSVGA